MYGIYYKVPMNFKDLMQKKELEKTNLENSVAQYINMAVTSSYGECKYNESFGCKIWETDFDILSDHNTMKQNIKKALTDTIKSLEKRLDLKEVEVTISEDRVASLDNILRMKKKVNVNIDGYILKTNRPFNFYGYFFLGPLSYI